MLIVKYCANNVVYMAVDLSRIGFCLCLLEEFWSGRLIDSEENFLVLAPLRIFIPLMVKQGYYTLI